MDFEKVSLRKSSEMYGWRTRGTKGYRATFSVQVFTKETMSSLKYRYGVGEEVPLESTERNWCLENKGWNAVDEYAHMAGIYY